MDPMLTVIIEPNVLPLRWTQSALDTYCLPVVSGDREQIVGVD